jgi:hypothetical protein
MQSLLIIKFGMEPRTSCLENVLFALGYCLYTGSISSTALAVLSAVVEQWDGTVVSHSSKSCAQGILLHIASPFNAQSLYQTPRCLHLKLEAWNAIKKQHGHPSLVYVCLR